MNVGKKWYQLLVTILLWGFISNVSLCAYEQDDKNAILVGLKHTMALQKSVFLPEKKHKEVIRVATYNVNRWQGAEKDILQAIRCIDADIVILQEMVSDKRIVPILRAWGYKYHTSIGKVSYAEGQGDNMVFSKLPFVSSSYSKKFSYADEDVCSFVKAEIDLSKYNKKNLVIYGAQLNNTNEKIRLLEAQELVHDMHRKDNDGKNTMIGADFNEQQGAAIKYLGAQGFINSFDLKGISQPVYTHWSKKVFDGLYVNRQSWNLLVEGSYTLCSGASGHLPVIMDIDPTK